MKLQPIEIEKYCIENHVKVHDEFGWTGEFKVSAKNILDMVINLTKSERKTPTEANKTPDTKQLNITDVSNSLIAFFKWRKGMQLTADSVLEIETFAKEYISDL